jgi:hypothetical protein
MKNAPGNRGVFLFAAIYQRACKSYWFHEQTRMPIPVLILHHGSQVFIWC